MDPVTTAIIAALVGGVAAGTAEVGKQAIVDAYLGLRSLIAARFGTDSDVCLAIEDLERKPDSEGRQVTLKEEIRAASVETDAAVVAAAQQLLQLLHAEGDERTQRVVRSSGARQVMRGKGGKMAQESTDSPDSEQLME